MAIPGNALSNVLIEAPFIGARNRNTVNQYIDWEDGPIAIEDVTSGLDYQPWRCRIETDSSTWDIIINPENGSDTTIITSSNPISECSLAFDQTGKPYIAYVENDVSKMYWYDSTIPDYDTLVLPANCVSPRITLDDKRPSQVGESDIILAYVNEGKLCYRQQRDRFLTEYILAEDLETHLVKIGMNVKYRMQFLVGNL